MQALLLNWYNNKKPNVWRSIKIPKTDKQAPWHNGQRDESQLRCAGSKPVLNPSSEQLNLLQTTNLKKRYRVHPDGGRTNSYSILIAATIFHMCHPVWNTTKEMKLRRLMGKMGDKEQHLD